jgi:hypothetical protein
MMPTWRMPGEREKWRAAMPKLMNGKNNGEASPASTN